RHGEVKIVYEHPLLESICSETYGIMVYQEQVMQSAQILAGYTLGAADILRRAMGKKKVEEMQKQREKFVKGCDEKNNIDPDLANEIFDLLEKFAGYGFNKSHAAAYAIVSYQTAYLKANYPVEFLSAMMTNDMSDTAKLSILINEARTFGVEVLPPDVNESRVAFAPAREGTVIRFGLAAIKGIGEVAVQSILDAREKGGKFTSLLELCERVDTRTVNRKVLEALIRSGACDAFGETRATLFAQIDHVLARAASVIQDRQRGQTSLFGMLQEASNNQEEKFARLPEWGQSEILAAEKELLGFYVTGHPLTPYASLLQRYGLSNTTTAAQLPSRSVTRIGGMIGAVQQGISKKSGKPYAMVTLEDLEGSCQLLCMNENFDKYRELLKVGNAVLVTGEVQNGEDRPKIFPQEIIMLEDAPRKFTKQVHFKLHTAHLTPEKLEQARNLVSAYPGRIPFFLCLRQPTGEAIFIEAHEKFGVTPTRQLEKAADELFGEETYYAKVDTTLPEPMKKRWEKKASNGGGDDE
ncbi:MAG: DNA polymerase III subunit alpha, partial [Verrucomicrobiales bacterium]